MTEQLYQPGETLDVTERVRVISTEQSQWGPVIKVKQVLRGGVRRDRLVAPNEPGTTVKRVTPADGIPRPGQVWGDRRGREWFAALPSPGSQSEVRLVSPESRLENWRDLHTDPEAGPLTLLRDVPSPADGAEES